MSYLIYVYSLSPIFLTHRLYYDFSKFEHGNVYRTFRIRRDQIVQGFVPDVCWMCGAWTPGKSNVSSNPLSRPESYLPTASANACLALAGLSLSSMSLLMTASPPVRSNIGARSIPMARKVDQHLWKMTRLVGQNPWWWEPRARGQSISRRWVGRALKPHDTARVRSSCIKYRIHHYNISHSDQPSWEERSSLEANNTRQPHGRTKRPEGRRTFQDQLSSMRSYANRVVHFSWPIG